MKNFRNFALSASVLALACAAHAESYTWMATINSVAGSSDAVTSPFGAAKPGDVISGRLVSNAQGTTLVTDKAIDMFDYLQVFDVSRNSGGSISYKVGSQTMQTTYFNLVSNSYASKNQSLGSPLVSSGSFTFKSTVSDAMYSPTQFATGDVSFQVTYPVADNTPWSQGGYKFGYPTNLGLSSNSKAPSKVSLYAYVPANFNASADYYMLRYADTQGQPLVIHYVNGQYAESQPLAYEQLQPTAPFWTAYEAYKAAGKTVVKQFVLSATLGSLIRVQ